MPCSPAKARLLLKEKKAIVKRRTPFTIQLTIATGEAKQPVALGVDSGQLTIATGEAKQPVALGVDSGYKHIGLSATTEKAELYASEVELRQDITDLLSSRHHGSFVCPSCPAPLSPQPQDALPCASFRQPGSKQAQRLACTFGGKPHCGAHVACRSGHAGLAGDCHNRRNSGV